MIINNVFNSLLSEKNNWQYKNSSTPFTVLNFSKYLFRHFFTNSESHCLHHQDFTFDDIFQPLLTKSWFTWSKIKKKKKQINVCALIIYLFFTHLGTYFDVKNRVDRLGTFFWGGGYFIMLKIHCWDSSENEKVKIVMYNTLGLITSLWLLGKIRVGRITRNKQFCTPYV